MLFFCGFLMGILLFNKLLKVNLRACESALKMPADRRDYKGCFQMKPGEWAFSLELLFSSFRLHCQEQFPKTDSKGVLWRVFA